MNNNFMEDAKRGGAFSTIAKKIGEIEKYIREHQSIQHKSFLQVLGANCQNTAIGAGLTNYTAPFMQGLSTTQFTSFLPIAGVLKKISVRIVSTQPASGSLVVTLVKNNIDTALFVTIPSGSVAGVYSNLVEPIEILENETVRWKIKNNALSNSAQINCVTTVYYGTLN